MIEFTPWPDDLAQRYRARGYWIDRPLTRILDEAVAARPGATAIVCGDRRLSYADLAAAAQISVADYLGGIDWAGHEQTRGWYSVFKSRPSFRPLLAERMEVIQPPSHYADVNA